MVFVKIGSREECCPEYAPCHGLVAFHVLSAERAFDACIRLPQCAQDRVSQRQSEYADADSEREPAR